MAGKSDSNPVALRAANSINQPKDPNTLSNYNAWRTSNTVANLTVDFGTKRLKGSVELTLQKLTRDERKIILDTSFLSIAGVRVGGRKAPWSLADSRTEPYGSPLMITVPEDSDEEQSSELKVEIDIATTDKCTALQWFSPAQTSNKKHPYMFSQCQAIHARSIFPCQDTPDVKSTYTFNIRSPLPVLASGLPTGAREFQPGSTDEETGTLLYTFHQAVPIPSYLFALASGDLACASIGPRSTVWTGPEELTACQWEFEADMETYMRAVEKIVYPYAWTTYNVLVLPPSFPYGGMENPVYTYATPTVVSGDRQNVDVIAHELSHSWSGNLVSNASWEHFWLNEGWTTYLERRLQAAIHGGDKYRDFSSIIGWKALTDSIEQFGEDHEFTKMIPDLKGKDPDDAFSSIPYEKGFTFLFYLEKLIGKDKWDMFIPHYFTTFKQRSVDSYEFKSTLIDFFASDAEAGNKLKDLDWDTWFYKPGYPPKPDFDTSLADVCYELASKWEALNTGKQTNFEPSKSDIEGWNANQSVVLLEQVQQFSQPLSPALVDKMGEAYAYTQSQNVEVVSRFYVVALQAKAEHFFKPAANLMARVGRMKFVRPLLRGLLKVDKALAKKTFEENKDFYHPICRGMMEKLIEKAD
ncbi:leukotriene A-4 hydrol [Polychaeton citri CBS 116435]|uniref:Leukotriene A(4) hydrolase n=1 Tax=Polychaeton citri CBS 116435 TaxID=1314669 RepID=A0A9P4QHA2_9PEZI|nr:leukotriene A-4 hydrol [Polychaeton citri CBS 116435]